MADQIPTYLVGTSPNFTAVGQLSANDRLSGIVNESDLVQNSIIFKDSAGAVDALALGSNTFVGNIGSGVAAVTAAQLLGALFTEFNGAKGDLLVHDGTNWVTLTPGANGQLLSADSAAATGLSFIDAPSGGGATTLDALTDTNLAGATSSQFLKYNGSQWVNSAVEIADVSWVDITGINDGEGLAWSAGAGRFEPVVLGAGSADDLGNHTATQDLQMGTFNVDLTTGAIDFSTTLDISSASWSLTEAAGAFTISTVSGGSTSRFSVEGDGDVKLWSYPNTRDDSGTTTPENFLYTNGSGDVLSADLDDTSFATWANISLENLTNVQDSASTTDGYVLTWDNGDGAWQAKASTAESQALTRIGGATTLELGRGYLLVNASYTLTLPSVGASDDGKQIKLVLRGGDWLASDIEIVVANGTANRTICANQGPFLANSSTLYLTYDHSDTNWVGSV